jgi:hypothetical protein
MQSFSPAFRGAENLDLKNGTKVSGADSAQSSPAYRKATPYRRIASNSGTKTTLYCLLGSVREMTAVADLVCLIL